MENVEMTQFHIEAARNSTDDFNLFHDKNRWNWIHRNPFNGPISLGFQLGCFIETQLAALDNVSRDQDHDNETTALPFPYTIYEFTFAGVVKPGDRLSLTAKPAKVSVNENGKMLSRRLLLKANEKAVILGYQRQSDYATIDIPDCVPDNIDWGARADRTFDHHSQCFLKRKYMIVGNAKNFLTSAFAEQAEYIDEFADKVDFPQMYPLSLMSSALLERAQSLQHDLINSPMIYASHKLCIDNQQLNALRSNDVLNIVVSPEIKAQGDNQKVAHTCVGYGKHPTPLFTATISLLPLAALLKE